MVERRILIAVDGSQASEMAVELGLELAADRGASVIFLHVAPDIADRLYDLDPVHGPSEAEVLAADPVLARAMARARAKAVVATAEVAGHRVTGRPLERSPRPSPGSRMGSRSSSSSSDRAVTERSRAFSWGACRRRS